MIDSKFALSALGLLAIAALPTTLHSYLEMRSDDGLRTAEIGSKLRITLPEGIPGAPRA